jgi:protein O-GlcNAc transferase
VAASVLLAMDLPELITDTPEAYECLAVELTLDPSKLAEIRGRLASNRLTRPLFDTGRFTRHIEAAYRAVYERHLAGLPPDHVHVSRL